MAAAVLGRVSHSIPAYTRPPRGTYGGATMKRESTERSEPARDYLTAWQQHHRDAGHDTYTYTLDGQAWAACRTCGAGTRCG